MPTADRHWLTVAVDLSRLSPVSPTHYAVGAVIVAPTRPGSEIVAPTRPVSGFAVPTRPDSGFAVPTRPGSGLVCATGFTGEADPAFHAEEAALAKLAGRADLDLGAATIYTSLEPCTARRSRPTACTQLILDAGIGRVVLALREPALFADCDGVATLRRAGVEVVELPGLADQVRDVNAHLLLHPAGA